MDQESIFCLVFIVGFSIVVLLHGSGLFLMHRVKVNLQNSKILMVNLALAEFLLSFHLVVTYSVYLGGHWNEPLNYMDIFMICMFYMNIRLFVLLIIVDRFAEIYLNIRYPLYMDLKRMRFLATALWALNVIAAGIFTLLYACKFVNYVEIWQIYDSVLIILDFVILVSLVTT